MDIHTENLTILFVDIAGFTATTNRQSRAENAALLHTFDSTLLPHIKRFKGRVVKSIGDALLLTFRSPTDSMLCAMALQDAMHESNLHVPEVDKIHIRIAASLGEVRVTPKDIFGEPVNVASRIEGIAPADEIYLSEAVFMAMNKAEVPAQEVGFRELAGLPQSIRIYSIPRFATHRLVPQNAVPDQGGELLFPYGGMHYRLPNGKSASTQYTLPRLSKKMVVSVAAIVVAVAGAGWAMHSWQTSSPEVPNASSHTRTIVSSPTSTVRVDVPATQPVVKPALKKAAENESAALAPAASVAREKNSQELARPEQVKSPASRRAQLLEGHWTVISTKEALRSGRISKEEYKAISRKIEYDYRRKIGRFKMQYRANSISKPEYERALKVAKQEYQGK